MDALVLSSLSQVSDLRWGLVAALSISTRAHFPHGSTVLGQRRCKLLRFSYTSGGVSAFVPGQCLVGALRGIRCVSVKVRWQSSWVGQFRAFSGSPMLICTTLVAVSGGEGRRNPLSLAVGFL